MQASAWCVMISACLLSVNVMVIHLHQASRAKILLFWVEAF
jgi:hypothetical protein